MANKLEGGGGVRPLKKDHYFFAASLISLAIFSLKVGIMIQIKKAIDFLNAGSSSYNSMGPLSVGMSVAYA